MNLNAVAIYPGTFDPMTNGHLDLVRRVSKLFGRLIIAVASNQSKAPFFSLDKRLEGVQASVLELMNVEVCPLTGLLVDFMRDQGAQYIVRGLRSASDFEYEFQLAGMNRELYPEVETVFFTPATEYLFVSSSLVREIFSLGGDITAFVPAAIQHLLFSDR